MYGICCCFALFPLLCVRVCTLYNSLIINLISILFNLFARHMVGCAGFKWGIREMFASCGSPQAAPVRHPHGFLNLISGCVRGVHFTFWWVCRAIGSG